MPTDRRRPHRVLETRPLDRPRLSGLVIVFLLFDGAIKLVPWPIVTETMDKMGYGSSESWRAVSASSPSSAPCSIRCRRPRSWALSCSPAISAADGSHVRIDSPLFSHTLFGFYLGLMVWGGLWLRDPSLRNLIPFRR